MRLHAYPGSGDRNPTPPFWEAGRHELFGPATSFGLGRRRHHQSPKGWPSRVRACVKVVPMQKTVLAIKLSYQCRLLGGLRAKRNPTPFINGVAYKIFPARTILSGASANHQHRSRATRRAFLFRGVVCCRSRRKEFASCSDRARVRDESCAVFCDRRALRRARRYQRRS
jgi:hypothetical protein